MLQLTANGNTLDIHNASFNLTLKSPLAGENAGSYVFSITIPYSPNNARAFSFPSRLTRMDVLTASLPGEIIYNSIHVQKGEWKAKTSTYTAINIEMVIGSSHFNTLVDGHNLPEYFDVTAGSVPMTGHVDSWVSKNYPDVNHQFPSIYNPSFYGDANPIFSGVLNDYADGFISDLTNHTCIVPQLYLLYIIIHLYEQQGYTPFGKVFDDLYLQKALLYNNFAIDRLESTYFQANASNLVSDEKLAILWNSTINDPLTQYTSSTGTYLIISPSTYHVHVFVYAQQYSGTDAVNMHIEIRYNNILIQSTITPVTNPGTSQYFESTIDFEILSGNINHSFEARVYYMNSVPIHKEAFTVHGHMIIYDSITPQKNIFGTSINYSNHVPDMDVKEFLNIIFSTFKILPFFDHAKKTVELVFLNDLLNSNTHTDLSEGLVNNTLKITPNIYKGLLFKFDFQGPDNLLENNFLEPETLTGTVETTGDLPGIGTGTPTLGDTYYVETLNAYYVYSFIPGEEEEDPGTTEWIPFADKHPDYIVDDGLEPISSQLAPMLMRKHGDPALGSLRNLPAIDATGTSKAFGVQGDFPLRIMFYVGLKVSLHYGSASNFEYPLATTTAEDSTGATVLPINYTWEDLSSRYWTNVIAWYKRRQKIEFTNLITPTFIANLNFQNKFFFQYTKVLFSEVVVNIKSKIFGAGKFKGWG